MPLEDLTGSDKFIPALNPAWPLGTDPKREGDDHLRGIKNVLQNAIPKFDAEVLASSADVNLIAGAATTAVAPLVPIGGVIPFAGSAIPTGWLECNYAEISRTTWAALFAVIGTVWGAGDGSTTFNLPDFRSRLAEGVSNAWPLGSYRGADSVTLTAAQAGAAAHTHTMRLYSTGLGQGGLRYDAFQDPGDSEMHIDGGAGENTGSTSATGTDPIDLTNARAAVYFIIRGR